MKKSEIKTVPEFYLPYITKAGDNDLMSELEEGGISLFLDNLEKLEKIGTKTYALGKWTIPQIIEHLIDAERIFQCRALRFVRQDKTPLPGFDENIYAAISRANERTLDDLLEEYQIVRLSTVQLYKHLDNEQLQYTGIANGKEISVLALGFIMIGHAVHHFNVIQERYFDLIED